MRGQHGQRGLRPRDTSPQTELSVRPCRLSAATSATRGSRRYPSERVHRLDAFPRHSACPRSPGSRACRSPVPMRAGSWLQAHHLYSCCAASQIAGAHNLSGGAAITGATDTARPVQESDLIAELPVQLLDAGRRLIHEHDRTTVPSERFCRPLLIVPRESVFRILRKLDIVRRVGVHEVAAVQPHRFDVSGGERPISEHLAVRREVARVADPDIPAERDIEFTGSVEAAQAVEPCSIEIVEERSRLPAVALTCRQQRVEAVPMSVENRLVILHREVDVQSLLQPAVEVDQVWVRVVQERAARYQPEGHSKTAAERFNQLSILVRFPQRPKMWNLPPFTAGPLERRT